MGRFDKPSIILLASNGLTPNGCNLTAAVNLKFVAAGLALKPLKLDHGGIGYLCPSDEYYGAVAPASDLKMDTLVL